MWERESSRCAGCVFLCVSARERERGGRRRVRGASEAVPLSRALFPPSLPPHSPKKRQALPGRPAHRSTRNQAQNDARRRPPSRLTLSPLSQARPQHSQNLKGAKKRGGRRRGRRSLSSRPRLLRHKKKQEKRREGNERAQTGHCRRDEDGPEADERERPRLGVRGRRAEGGGAGGRAPTPSAALAIQPGQVQQCPRPPPRSRDTPTTAPYVHTAQAPDGPGRVLLRCPRRGPAQQQQKKAPTARAPPALEMVFCHPSL